MRASSHSSSLSNGCQGSKLLCFCSALIFSNCVRHSAMMAPAARSSGNGWIQPSSSSATSSTVARGRFAGLSSLVSIAAAGLIVSSSDSESSKSLPKNESSGPAKFISTSAATSSSADAGTESGSDLLQSESDSESSSDASESAAYCSKCFMRHSLDCARCERSPWDVRYSVLQYVQGCILAAGPSALRDRVLHDDSESSDSDNQEQPPPPPKSKPRRTRDDVSGNKTFDSRTRTSRRPSERQDNINKENLQTTEQKLLKAQKDLEKAKRQLRKATNTETKDDDDMESEEQEEEDVDPGVTSFKSSIRAMQPLPAEAPRPTTVLRKRSDPKPPPKISSRAYLALPEIAAGPDTSPPASPRHYDDRVDDVPMDLDDVPPPPRGAAAATPRRATESHGDSHSHYDSTPATSMHDHRGRPAAPDTTTRKRHQQSSPAPAPPPKRKRKEPKFAEGFIIVAGIKSKAADYEPEVKALILRACNEYAVRILIMNAFPDSALQTQWGKECFRNACRAAQQFYSSTTRIITLITRRGSHTRSLIVQACRACFAAHYTFNQSSTSAAVMVSNSKLSEKLRASAAFHYKDTNERTGYGGNPILAQMRHSKLFEGKKSLGAIFATKFDPYPLATLALEFAAIEHCAKEWSTGKFISADFSEKETLEPYKTHLKDIQEWHSLNEQVVQNIRHKWFVRATRKLELPTTPDGASHLDSMQKDALRDELAGRTGETDSEPELEGGDP